MKLKLMTLIAVTATAFTMAAKAETKSEDLPGVAPQPASYFYTGKLYDADLGAYVFNYRNYDVGLNRWTTADPSGFPDGSNVYSYCKDPVGTLDSLGLWYEPSYGSDRAAVDFAVASAAVNGLGAAGYSVSEAMGDYSLSQDPEDYGAGSWSNPATRVAPSGEISMLKQHDAFTTKFNSAYFGARTNGMTTADFSFTQLVDFGDGDAHFSYGRVAFEVSGTFTYSHDSMGNTMWSAPGTLFLFDDHYDFDVESNNPAISAFARLQYHDIVYSYVNSGEFSLDFSE